MANVQAVENVSSLKLILDHVRPLFEQKSMNALPDPQAVQKVVGELASALGENGLPIEAVREHLLGLTNGLSRSSLSSTYYGFVIGGVTPYALLADILATIYDQNAHAHLPEQSVATHIEDRALTMLLELLHLDLKEWKGRTLTTGATASNIQGLACGREWILQARLESGSVGELGLLESCRRAGVTEIKVLSTKPHSSVGKAASIVGLGRGACLEVGQSADDTTAAISQDLRFDLKRLEQELRVDGRACIVCVSCGEVNTGNFATYDREEMLAIRNLCDKYKAWLHVDGAFGIFSRLLSSAGKDYELVSRGGAGVEVADSIAGDLHKFLNVPYDCGFYTCRYPWVQTQVYQNANASYLNTGQSDIPTPLNIGAENSRRFRGFAVYGTLLGFGRVGYTNILKVQVDLARKIAQLVDSIPELTLLNGKWHEDRDRKEADYSDVFMIVLFSAKSDGLNAKLVEAINSQKAIYVSGSSWDGRPACRIAVSNWQVDVDRDLKTVQNVLEAAVATN